MVFLGISDLVVVTEKKKMKVKKTTKKVVKKEPTEKIIEEVNGTEEKINGATPSPTHIHLTDAEKEKGKFEHFNISKKTIQKLKGKRPSSIIATNTAAFRSSRRLPLSGSIRKLRVHP